MCTRIKETDINYADAQNKVAEDGCLTENTKLTYCLKENKGDWRACKDLTDNLEKCLNVSKKS